MGEIVELALGLLEELASRVEEGDELVADDDGTPREHVRDGREDAAEDGERGEEVGDAHRESDPAGGEHRWVELRGRCREIAGTAPGRRLVGRVHAHTLGERPPAGVR